MPDELNENKFGYEVAIAEMKYLLEEQYKSISAVKNITQIIFGSSSLVVALLGALQIFSVQVDPAFDLLYKAMIVFVMALYALLVSLSIVVLSPARVKGPTAGDRQQIFERLIWQTDDLLVLRQQLDNYLAAIDANAPVIIRRYRLARITAILFPVIVLILLGLALLPRTVLC